MKKLLLSLLAGSLLLSGCGAKEEVAPTPATPNATISEEKAKEKEAVEQSPEDLFYSLAQANLDYSVELLNKNFPSKEVFEKGEKTFSINAQDLSLEGTPAQTGKLSFDISTKIVGDFSDTNAVQASKIIDVTASLQEAIVAGDITSQVEVRIVDNALFASLQSLTLNSAMIPKEQVEALAGPFIGKWFGNTFEELNALQQGAEKIDLQKFMTGTPMGVLAWEIIEDEQKNLRDYFEFVAFTEEKDGIFYFEAKQKTEKTAKNITAALESLGLPQSTVEEITKSTASANNETIVIGYKASDSSFVLIASPAINPKTQKKIEGKTNTVLFSDTELELEVYLEEQEVVRVQAKDGKFTIGGSSADKKDFTIVTGTYTDTTFTFEAVNPKFDSATTNEGDIAEKVSGNFTKTGNAWAGEITNTINPAVVVKITNASYSKENVSISISVAMGEYTYGPVNFAATIAALDSVSVEKPTDAESFETIQKMLAPQQVEPFDQNN